MRVRGKQKRQRSLKELLDQKPFSTDEDLSKAFKVSVQTIRLDRLELGIPELRERMKVLAEDRLDQVRTLTSSELVGELLDLELGERGISVLEITPEMVFERTGIARGHLLFAQANSLAVAMIDAEQALTGSAKIAFKRPVLQGEKVVAKGIVKTKRDNRFYIKVHSKVDREVVFTASFVVFVINSEGGIPVENNG